VIEFFHALGIPLAELYGMSESCGAGCVNPPHRVKIGTVGPPLPGVEVRLADDNEILLRGPVVMSGYRTAPEKTREVIDGAGWLATGDIGEFDEDGYLRIVDRKKELIINAAGKNMSPANIEAAIKGAGPLIDQAVAIGDNRPYNVALLVLDPDAARAFAAKHGVDPGELAAHPALAESIEATIEKANATLARVEQIKRWKLLPGEWQPGGDELTPTSKLKRKPIATKYAQEIEALYAE
jgi:long-subunit acyl-CoA synthetase (AMP-forming)